MQPTVHVIHLLSAGIWLGGLVFVLVVLLPALRRMSPTIEERIKVRAAIGPLYIIVSRINLVILLFSAVLDTFFRGWRVNSIIEIALIIVVFVLSETLGTIGARLIEAVRDERAEDRKSMVRMAAGISSVSLLLSFILMILAILEFAPALTMTLY